MGVRLKGFRLKEDRLQGAIPKSLTAYSLNT
ncbi:protein of unknown function [Candidatus Methylomirabilis oxygeniifera]|uniref:Uncharacterized protein n=1 Tax=Methylomirabilis oxygeniifera TaxID=671143 RepID=D5MLG2_METO1|nr:protein of unknown function [Candidatus Methylomirabilis oxyfera]